VDSIYLTTETYMPRGKGKKPALVHVNVRLPIDVLDYYKQFPSYTIKMREVLEKHAKEVGQSQGE